MGATGFDGKDLLEVTDLGKNFGGLAALHDISFNIPRERIIALIGPNGAGKTTLFNVITGVYVPNSGSIKIEGMDITGKPPHVICKIGIARTFQIVRPFLQMTSLENVMVGAMFGNMKELSLKEASEKAHQCLEFVNLAEKKDVVTSNLTLPDRKRVELAKALASNPKIVLLDEVISGLNPTEVVGAMDLIRKIRDELKITVFWVEHIMEAVIRIADLIIVLHYGEKIAEDTPQQIVNNKKVIDAYLGEQYVF
jgi:branched-chain amino acid transport system ATP-binding protein